MKKVEIYSDWWARPNPGPWAYGVILRFWAREKELSWFEENTTNNRMELTWVIKWFESLKESCEVEVFTDSSYVVNGIEKGWAEAWQKNNWLKADKKKAENSDLWEKLLTLLKKHKVKFNWVKWHAWHEENERCDELATKEILKNTTSTLAHSNQTTSPLAHSNQTTSNLAHSNQTTSPLAHSNQTTSPLAPLLRGEGDDNVWMRENYKKIVPKYVKDLAKDLRKVWTNSEKILWEVLRNRKLNNIKFRRQHPFWRYIADFYSDELKLVIELDWEVHNNDNQKEYDKIRDGIIYKYW